MNNYFSDFVSKFGGHTWGSTSYSEVDSKVNNTPRIGFVTLYNPSWANENDESLDGLSKQVLFFVAPRATDNQSFDSRASEELGYNPVREHLNIVGLLRGTCSLMSDFGSTAGPVTIDIKNGAIIDIELESGFFLAISLVTNTDEKQKRNICVKQLMSAAQKNHRIFELINSPITNLVQLYGRKQSSELLKNYWQGFLNNFNFDQATSFGPSKILWPNRLNTRGFFDFLPKKCYKKSSIRLNKAILSEIDKLVLDNNVKPSGYIVASMDTLLTKNSGIIHMNLGEKKMLDKDSVICVYEMLEDVNASNCLNFSFFSQLNNSQDIYTSLSNKWQRASETQEHQSAHSQPEESEDESLQTNEYHIDAVNALAMLNPLKLPESLVSSPLNSTLRGFRSLGQTVTEQVHEAPNWFNRMNYFATTHESENNTVSANQDDNIPSVDDGEYFLGLNGDEITRFLVHIPTISHNSSSNILEYSLVAYRRGDIITVLFYESGYEVLDSESFYLDLESCVLNPLAEVIRENDQDLFAPLENSVGSLLDPIEAAVHSNTEEQEYGIDNKFFFIIYDSENKSYETSLPDFQVARPKFLYFEQQKPQLERIMFHLHDHLVKHYIFETKERIFQTDGMVCEQLHKFSSSKHNNWLFYSMRHEKKIIIIIRDSSYKVKSKPVLSPEKTYLMNIADRVYGAANYGFLEILGGDVKVWLGGLGMGPEEENIE